MPYPTPPGPRLAYDKDGTVVFISAYDGAVTMLDVTGEARWALNSERVSGLAAARTKATISTPIWYGATPNQAFVAFIFPIPTRIYGIYPALVHRNSFQLFQGAADVYGSTNTTNGLDGTWTLIASSLRSFKAPPYGAEISSTQSLDYRALDGVVPSSPIDLPPNNDAYRRLMAVDGVGITSLAGAATRHLKGLRVNFYARDTLSDPNQVVWPGSNQVITALAIHLYGAPEVGGGEDRIAMWSADLDIEAPVGTFDWSDVPLGSSADKSFRLKNVSASKTATGITVLTSPSLTDGPVGSKASQQFLYSMDNKETWTSTLTIAALSPGASSGILWVRRTTPTTAALSNWAPRVLAEVETWA